MEKKYDIAIIGGGFGGLVCATILGRHGYKVCVVEKNRSIGGCLQDFNRDGCHFDTGIHYIGSYDKDQILRKLFEYLDIDRLIEVQKLSESGFDKISVNGTEYSIPQGIENYRRQLKDDFPNDYVAIDTYIAKMLEIVSEVALLNLHKVQKDSYELYEGLGISAYDYICSLTDNQSLRDVLSVLSVLSNNQKTTATLHYHMIVSHSYIQSAYKVKGGGRAIVEALYDVMKNQEVDFILQAQVTDIQVAEKRIQSVGLADGRKIEADAFISDIPPLTFMSMLPPKAVKKSYLHRLERQKKSIPVFSLYIVLEDCKMKYTNSNFYYFKDSDAIWRGDKIDMNEWPTGFMMCVTESENNVGYVKNLVIISPIEYDKFEKWADTKVGKRGLEYAELKKECTQLLIQQIELTYPDFSKWIKSISSSSPLTYRDYTGVAHGGMYGTLKDCKNPMGSTVTTFTSIKNLILTGQSINFHGILGVFLTALLSCGSFIDINELIKEINEKEK